MQIALIRHGKPNFDDSPITAQGLDGWTRAYNRAGIDPAVPPPSGVVELADNAAYSLSSDLPRAVESLRTLVPEQTAPAERLYREAGAPKLPPTLIKLDPQVWAALAQTAWFLGWSYSTESAFRARRCARKASERLSTLAADHGSVLLLGHGVFNTLIAWELRAAGWSGPMWPTGTYWSSAVYRKRSG